MFSQLPFPVLSTVQVMAQHPNAVLRLVGTYNKMKPKEEIMVAQVAEWDGNLWNGHWVTDPSVYQEVIGRRLVTPTEIPGAFKLLPETLSELRRAYDIQSESTPTPTSG